jgi:vacuole morphology and inheritance protein 14
MLLRYFRYAFLRKHMNMHQIFSTFCERIVTFMFFLISGLTLISADLEVTVQLLVQIDKLVQLLESPVFTCEW